MESPDLSSGFHDTDKVLFPVTGQHMKIQIEKFRGDLVVHSARTVNGVGGSVEHVPLFQRQYRAADNVSDRVFCNIDDPVTGQ